MSGPNTSPQVGAAVHTAALELVVAVAENDVIGRDNALPWRLPADLRRFKALTLGKPVLMGRKTYESIGKALPGRANLVLTRSAAFRPADCRVFSRVGDAIREVGAEAAIMVIGGAEIYRQCLPQADRIHLTLVHSHVENGDTFFRGWREPGWREAFRERHEADDQNPLAYSFITLERSAAASVQSPRSAAGAP
jgi:dihydrofolate reductase